MASTFFWGDRTWGPGDKAAFAGWLQRHGVSYNAWARNHPGAAAVFGGKAAGTAGAAPVVDPLYTQAQAQAGVQNQADIDAVNRARAAAAESAKNSMTNMTGFYKALAGMMGSIGPATADTYKQATGTEAAIGKGFSDAQAAIQSGEAKDMGGFLNLIGAPHEQVQQVLDKVGGPGAADVVYGLGAAIPATALNREGAAFTAAADRLPAYAAGSGIENLRMIQSEAAKTDSGFNDQIQGIIDKLPATTQEIYANLQESNRAERALQVQEAYYNQSAVKTNAELTGTLPDGTPTYSAKQDANKKAADAKAAKAKRNQAREDAFMAARQDIFKQAKGLSVPLTIDEKTAWVVAHPGKGFSDAPNTKPVNYAQAKKALFNQYKDLLRFATAAGKAALKKRLNQMIDEALAAAGIHPQTKTTYTGGFARASSSPGATMAGGYTPGGHP